MEEVWKPIPNYEGIYEASNQGRIRTAVGKTTYSTRHGERHWKQRYLKFKTEKAAGYRSDYRVCLWKDKKPKHFLVSRLICMTFNGVPSNEKMTVDHLNGNFHDNRAENLEWVSRSENTKRGWNNSCYGTQKLAVVLDKSTGVSKYFYGVAQASVALGYSKSYLSSIAKRKNKENERFRVEVFEF